MGIDPMTLAMVAQVGGSLLQAGGSMREGSQQRAAAYAQAQQLDQQAAAERDTAQAIALRIRRAGRQTQGDARAAYAASGVTVDTGTAGVVDRQIGLDAETDAYMAILSGDRQAATLDYEASLVRRAGRNAQRAARGQAFNSILGAATSFGSWGGGGASGGISVNPQASLAGSGNALGNLAGLSGTWGGVR